jgi:hypothetical protein
METLLTLQSATRAARARTGNPRLSVGVRAGLYQVQRVTMRPGRTADVQPLTDWLELPAALAALDRVEG